jgi:hypothetical protein
MGHAARGRTGVPSICIDAASCCALLAGQRSYFLLQLDSSLGLNRAIQRLRVQSSTPTRLRNQHNLPFPEVPSPKETLSPTFNLLLAVNMIPDKSYTKRNSSKKREDSSVRTVPVHPERCVWQSNNNNGTHM